MTPHCWDRGSSLQALVAPGDSPVPLLCGFGKSLNPVVIAGLTSTRSSQEKLRGLKEPKSGEYAFHIGFQSQLPNIEIRLLGEGFNFSHGPG